MGMADPWNLSALEWSHLLVNGYQPETEAAKLAEGRTLPWSEVLLKFTGDSDTVLDLGSGRGEHSSVLAIQGRKTALVDWSWDNIDFSSRVFKSLGHEAHFAQADITQPLPFKSGSFDVVFSCGVFEYFRDEEIDNILAEAFRVARKRVIIMAPNALSLAYRIGKSYLEKTGQWNWGGERPSYTLKPNFRRFTAGQISEFLQEWFHQ